MEFFSFKGSSLAWFFDVAASSFVGRAGVSLVSSLALFLLAALWLVAGRLFREIGGGFVLGLRLLPLRGLR